MSSQEEKTLPLGAPLLAWGLPTSVLASAVPLTQEDLKDGLTLETYLDRLAARVAWMANQEPNPQQAMTELAAALEEAGVWDGPRRFPTPEEAAQAMLVDNPAFLTAFSPHLSLPQSSPWPVRRMPMAERAILDNALVEWTDAAIASPHSLE